jgi:hypothetical protein
VNGYSDGNLSQAGFDYTMGAGDGSRGDGGRALVHDLNDSLTINYANDFTGGVKIVGNANITGTLTAGTINYDTMNIAGNMNVAGNVNVAGNETVSGNLAVTGTYNLKLCLACKKKSDNSNANIPTSCVNMGTWSNWTYPAAGDADTTRCKILLIHAGDTPPQVRANDP